MEESGTEVKNQISIACGAAATHGENSGGWEREVNGWPGNIQYLAFTSIHMPSLCGHMAGT